MAVNVKLKSGKGHFNDVDRLPIKKALEEFLVLAGVDGNFTAFLTEKAKGSGFRQVVEVGNQEKHSILFVVQAGKADMCFVVRLIISNGKVEEVYKKISPPEKIPFPGLEKPGAVAAEPPAIPVATVEHITLDVDGFLDNKGNVELLLASLHDFMEKRKKDQFSSEDFRKILQEQDLIVDGYSARSIGQIFKGMAKRELLVRRKARVYALAPAVCLKLASKSTVELVPEQVEEKIKRLVEVSRRVNEVNEELVGVDELLGVINQRISSLEGEIDAFKKERAGILARQEELRQKLPDAKMLKRIEAFKKVLE